METVRLDIGGLSCAGCAGRTERALNAVPGVESATVNFASSTALVEFPKGRVDTNALINAVEDAGYQAWPKAEGSLGQSAQSHADQIAQTRLMALIAAILTLPVFITEMGGHLFPSFHHWLHQTIGLRPLWILQFVLTTLVLVWPGRMFFTIGIPALLRRTPEMNSLVALGSGAAWVFSTLVLLIPNMFPETARVVYFEAAAVIVTLILTGRWLEARARGRTGAAIEALIGLQPETAQVKREGHWVAVAVDDLRIGDVIQIKPGERLPVDGIIASGQSYVDESMITGEPNAVGKAAGDEVIGGTINTSGAFQFKATRVGEGTTLAGIIRMVSQAQDAKLPIQALADRVIRVFVPAVIVIALITLVAWLIFGPQPALIHALVASVSVLIIACPCAMGLATPTSIMVGTGRAAELGVFFRRGEALQRLDEVRTIAFDKTGTLTKGRPTVVSTQIADGFNQADVLRMAAAVEAQSEHPIARALVETAGQTLPDVSGFTSHTSFGVSGSASGHQIFVGNTEHLQQTNIANLPDQNQISAIGEQGQTPILIGVDGQFAGMLGIADPLRPESKQAIETLHQNGISVAMLTGDRPETAQAIAAQLGIDHIRAGLRPEDKLTAIDELRQNGPVVFVGDGINDAPALAKADVAIALGTGTDIAMETADVVLVSSDLSGVINAQHLSHKTMQNIRQNLFWAFAYNAALLPVAAGVLYPAFGLLLSPMLAAGAMALSSVCVVSNALRLRNVKPLLIPAKNH
ncbi:Copper-transporting P-type ATPase [Roseovarius albus]|uniref:P-type Cu(+) transporter n=1 Tax=Roseovarius albus TaxID=1247867 RepID=A0A1X6Z725_9RHOB|nr:heavy metal translocating P-type ATPase [Roseovarius albus]SLN42433.1 Copper-transporting P-type ATPase [Roseovarius albus]